ncbi:hypothetical protein KJ909_03030, partial [Patescibacteria group bacterium]|nr:hypothetical protein [Patescibacteria group bacterium]
TQGSCASAPVYCPFDGSSFGCNNTPFFIKVLPAVARTQSASASTSTPLPTPSEIPQGSKACQVNIKSINVAEKGATIWGNVTTQRSRCNQSPPELYLVAENGERINNFADDFIKEEVYGNFYQYHLYGYPQEEWQSTPKKSYQELVLTFWSSPQLQQLVFSDIPDGKYHLFCQEKEDAMVSYNPTVWYGLCDWVDTGNPYCAVNGGSRADAGLCGSAWSSGPGSSAEFKVVHLTPTFTPMPTSTIRPTNTPYLPTPFATLTPRPTSVPRPTATLRPTSTIRPTSTPIPTMTTRPTSTPLPTSTIRSTFKDCSSCPPAISTWTECFGETTSPCIRYDMNLDGVVNIFDVVYCSNVCGVYTTPTSVPASVSATSIPTTPAPSSNLWSQIRNIFVKLF